MSGWESLVWRHIEPDVGTARFVGRTAGQRATSTTCCGRRAATSPRFRTAQVCCALLSRRLAADASAAAVAIENVLARSGRRAGVMEAVSALC